jgi:hypothetical protein
MHEILTVEPHSWGYVLAIRTGPAEFSKLLVTMLRRRGLRGKDGRVWQCRPCLACRGRLVGLGGAKCAICDGTGLETEKPLDVPDEQTLFQLAGMAYLPPEKRVG